MCISCLKQGVKGTVAVGNKTHFLLSGTTAGEDILKKKMCSKTVHDNSNIFGAEVISKGVSMHVNDSPAHQRDNGGGVVRNMLKWDCPACTGVLPHAENQNCQQCYKGVHI